MSTALVRSVVSPEVAGSSHRERFALARARPACGVAMARTPPARMSVEDTLVPLSGLIVGGGGLGLLAYALAGGERLAMIGVAALWALLMGAVWRSHRRRANAPLRRALALVVQLVPPAVGRPSPRVVLELEDGRRVSCDVPVPIDPVVVGDIGVAYARGDRLVDFVRLDV